MDEWRRQMTDEPKALFEPIKATAEALKLLPPIPVDPPKRKSEKVTEAFRMANEDVWRATRSDGVPFLYRTLAGVEGWIREGTWPTGPDGLPVSMGAMIALAIPEPPGGSLADVYVAPNDRAAFKAVLSGRVWTLPLGGSVWTAQPDPSAPRSAASPSDADFGPPLPPASIRVQRIRQARAEGREI
jgi:hypothetical protein